MFFLWGLFWVNSRWLWSLVFCLENILHKLIQCLKSLLNLMLWGKTWNVHVSKTIKLWWMMWQPKVIDSFLSQLSTNKFKFLSILAMINYMLGVLKILKPPTILKILENSKTPHIWPSQDQAEVRTQKAGYSEEQITSFTNRITSLFFCINRKIQV